MSLPFLETIGLTKKEADIYELLLSLGEVEVSEVIRKTRLKRATVYKSLYSLEKRGLITKRDKNKKIHVKPESPVQLTALAESEIKKIERAKHDLASLLPQLSQSYITSVEKPVVSVFQGVEGIKSVYQDTLKEGKTIYAALTTNEVEPTIFRWVTKTYTKERIEAGIKVKVIVASGGWASEYVRRNPLELRESMIVDAQKYPFQHEIDIYGNKVAFIDFRKGGSLIGVIIQHPQIAATMKALWKLAWEK